ncbi:MAG: ferritin-like protein [Roseiflexaceae bacterium]
MRLHKDEWTLRHLQEHLQYAVDLEFWTIPFYMSALYSITDRSSEAFQLIQSVVNQEMLHVQLASNIANAYGLSPDFRTPVYHGQHVPHLDFRLDTPSPVAEYSPYSAEIGPLDLERVNAMCLIEYPAWAGTEQPDLHDNVKEYANIGDFYYAVAYGARQLKAHVRGGINQVDHFSAYYRNMPSLIVSESGDAGFNQIDLLIQTITDQGEGVSQADESITYVFQNTATDSAPELDHYDKFRKVREALTSVETYARKPESDYTPEDQQRLAILQEHFSDFRHALKQLFAGQNPDNFVSLMITVGADIQNCWKNGVTPRFA